MQWGMPTLIENHTLEDNLRVCKSLGLQFLELNMNFPEYQLHLMERADAFYAAADAAGLYYTLHLDENLNIADFNPLVADAYMQTVKRTVALAKRWLPLRDRYGLCSQPLVINMHMHHGIYITLPDRKVRLYARDFDRYIDAFVRFRTLCEEWIDGADLVICIENTDGFHEYEKKALEHLLKSPQFALTWDIGHSKALGETDVPFIMAHARALKHFHIHDGVAKSDLQPGRNHLALGEGDICIKDRLCTAQAAHARCVLETKTVASLQKSVEYLRRHEYFVSHSMDGAH